MEAKIENTGFKLFLAIFGNRWVTGMGLRVIIWVYNGKEQCGWCYWIAGHYFLDHGAILWEEW